MGGGLLIFLMCNIFIFTFIFWLLIYLTRYFFFKGYNKTKNIFYECGFKAYESIDFKITSNILFIAVLLVLYDIEFLLLLPAFANITISSIYIIIFVILTLSLIGLLLYIDNLFLFLYWNN